MMPPVAARHAAVLRWRRSTACGIEIGHTDDDDDDSAAHSAPASLTLQFSPGSAAPGVQTVTLTNSAAELTRA